MTVKIQKINGVLVKICPSCKKKLLLTNFAIDKTKKDSRTSHCKSCRNIYKRVKRALGYSQSTYGKKYYVENPEKTKAKGMIQAMISKGLIERPSTCEICDKPCKPDGHHPDYLKPYEVYWLCKDCHRFVHSSYYTGD